jgi:hypothetical protein
MQKDYRFVCCFLSAWKLSYSTGTTLTEGVSGTGRRRKYLSTRRREQTEVRANCTGSFTSPFVLIEHLLEWSGWLGCLNKCVRWHTCGTGKCILGLDGSTWETESMYLHTQYIHTYISKHTIHTYIHTYTHICIQYIHTYIHTFSSQTQ